jgi:hypothetical protein
MFNFQNLDGATRKCMIEEINWAIRNNAIYNSTRFVPGAKEKWPDLLLEAAKSHNEHWLARQIEENFMLNGSEPARKPKGGYTIKHVPDTASETLAEGQFNRYYILGLCQRAILESKKSVEIYRAKHRDSPRSKSQALIGQTIDAKTLIDQLRPVDSSLNSELLKPNSGLSIKLL